MLVGFFMGKMSYVREESVELMFFVDEVISEFLDLYVIYYFIIIIGNLIDNVIDLVCY